jgi:hypothetical protein
MPPNPGSAGVCAARCRICTPREKNLQKIESFQDLLRLLVCGLELQLFELQSTESPAGSDAPPDGRPAAMVSARKDWILARYLPSGSRRPISHLANVVGSTPIFSAADSRDNPSPERWRFTLSPVLSPCGRGSDPRNLISPGSCRLAGSLRPASQLATLVGWQ